MPMLLIISCLGPQLLGNFIRQFRLGPDLAVRMRVGTTHQRPFVLEDLDIKNEIFRAELGALCGPGAEDILDNGQVELRQGQVMAGREAHHPAQPTLRLETEQEVVRGRGIRHSLGQQGVPPSAR